MHYFFKALQIMGIAADWSAKALEDGKVTIDEAIDLAKRVCDVLDIPLEIELPE